MYCNHTQNLNFQAMNCSISGDELLNSIESKNKHVFFGDKAALMLHIYNLCRYNLKKLK